ncbi:MULTISPECIES: chorismate mutase [Falsihalocynthiibacter]|uniref:chorismate mutase n=1 Tax=Falsihalocynthiibacter TaxID=2854182 RepID=UPI003001C593
MRDPKNCKNMTELRVEIDALDRELVSKLALRLKYIDRAAEIKMRDGLPANIPARVEDVVEKVTSQARVAGLAPALAESIWREMIGFSIAREEAVLNSPKESPDDSNVD